MTFKLWLVYLLFALFIVSIPLLDARAAKQGPKDTDPAKLAVLAIRQIADEIRACGEESNIVQTKDDKKKTRYYRLHWGPPTDVRFDVKASDSLVAPFEGVIEFSLFSGMSHWYLTSEEAKTGSDFALVSRTTRHRHNFRITDSSVQLDYRNYYDDKRQEWVLEQGSPMSCWERIGYK